GIPNVSNKREGTRLIAELLKTDKVITVKPAVNSGHDSGTNLPTNAENANNSKGSGSTIWFDNSKDGVVYGEGKAAKNADGTYSEKTQTILGHEFLHTENAANGTQDRSESGVKDPDSPSNYPTTMTKDEVNVREKEKAIRVEQNEKERATK
ncbi:MAG: M91 family zinc metallopeptidase, partial [Mariniphaga sp.]